MNIKENLENIGIIKYNRDTIMSNRIYFCLVHMSETTIQ